MDEELTTEESEALEAMKADDQAAPAVSTEEVKAAEASEATEEEKKVEDTPEFKSERAQTMVPHQAMHAERMKRQAAEAKLAEIEERLKAVEKPPEQAPQWVDPLVDPEGHRKWTEHQTAQTNAKLEEITKARAQETEVVQRQARANQYETEFVKDNPDFGTAAEFAAQSRLAELSQMGLSEQQAIQRLGQETTALFSAAEAAGINPCTLIYQRAAQIGYVRADPEADAKAKVEEETAKLAALSAAQEATKTAATKSSAAEGASITPEQLANMSEAEFAAFKAKNPVEFNRAMGA